MIHYSRFGGDLSRSRGLVHDFFPATSVRRPVRRRTGWPGLMIGTQRERARGYRRGVRGVKLFGLMMVRNEADIIQLNILHHLAAGVDCFLVVDNGSTDGTDRILDRLSRRLPLVWTRYEGPYYQWDITTQLAREAYLRGADWVVAIDADEFWWSPENDLKAVPATTSADALQVTLVNFIQRRDRVANSPENLLSMTRRAPNPVGPIDVMRRRVEARDNSYVEMEHPAKWMARASAQLEIGLGNHSLNGVGGELLHTDEIVCLHAPLRSKQSLENLADAGRRASEAGIRLIWQWFRWHRLAAGGELDKEWAANSYDEKGLNVFGKTHELTVDPRLRDAVAPWLGGDIPETTERPGESAWPLTITKPEMQSRRAVAADIPERIESLEVDAPPAAFARLAPVLNALLVDKRRSVIMQAGGVSVDWMLLLGRRVHRAGADSTVTVIDLAGKPDGAAIEPTDGPNRRARHVEQAGLGKTVEILGYHTQFPYSFHPISFPSYWDRPIDFLLVESREAYLEIQESFTDFEFWVATDGYLAFTDSEGRLAPAGAMADQLVASNRYREVSRHPDLIVLQKL